MKSQIKNGVGKFSAEVLKKHKKQFGIALTAAVILVIVAILLIQSAKSSLNSECAAAIERYAAVYYDENSEEVALCAPEAYWQWLCEKRGITAEDVADAMSEYVCPEADTLPLWEVSKTKPMKKNDLAYFREAVAEHYPTVKKSAVTEGYFVTRIWQYGDAETKTEDYVLKIDDEFYQVGETGMFAIDENILPILFSADSY